MTELRISASLMEVEALKLRMDNSKMDLVACRLDFKSSFDSYLIACEAFSEATSLVIPFEVL